MNQPIKNLDFNQKLVFNAQKFHIDNPAELENYHRVMRKYMENVLCTEKYFNKSSELYVYVEWMGEEDYYDEFLGSGTAAVAPVSPKKIQSMAKNILHLADKKENDNDGS